MASRQEKSYADAAKKRPSLRGARFVACDIDSRSSLEVRSWLGLQSLLQSIVLNLCMPQAALAGADLVLHAAGPFQRKGSRLVLETAIALGVPYVDVCDDAEYAQSCRELHQQAVDAGVPCITTAGIYPGERSVCVLAPKVLLLPGCSVQHRTCWSRLHLCCVLRSTSTHSSHACVQVLAT